MERRTISSITFDMINKPLEGIYGSLTSTGLKRMFFYIRNVLLIKEFEVKIDAPNRTITVKNTCSGIRVIPKTKSIETMKTFSFLGEYTVTFE